LPFCIESKNPVISPPISSSPNQEMQVFLDEPQLPFVDQSVQIPEWKNPHHPSLPAPHSYRKTKVKIKAFFNPSLQVSLICFNYCYFIFLFFLLLLDFFI